MGTKTTTKERLARTLKQGSTIPEMREFRQQCRDVYSLSGLDEWSRPITGVADGTELERKAAVNP